MAQVDRGTATPERRRMESNNGGASAAMSGAGNEAMYKSEDEARDEDRSLGELIREFARETQTLVRQDLQLVKAEATEKASKASKHALLLATGGFVAYAGFLVMLAALGFLLALFMPLWLGFFITAAVVLIIGLALLASGRTGLKKTNFALERTARTLQEEKRWLTREIRDAKSDPATRHGA